MKKILILITVVLSFSINAETTKEKMEYCGNLATLAKSTMETRQAGATLTSQLKALDNIKTSKDIYEIFSYIIIKSYDYPKFNGEKYKKETVNEYENKILKECLK